MLHDSSVTTEPLVNDSVHSPVLFLYLVVLCSIFWNLS